MASHLSPGYVVARIKRTNLVIDGLHVERVSGVVDDVLPADDEVPLHPLWPNEVTLVVRTRDIVGSHLQVVVVALCLSKLN